MPPLDWSRRFEDSIPLPDGRSIRSLRDAATYIMRLPKQVREEPAWQLAGRILIAAAEGRDFPMHARIAVLKALDAPAEPKPRGRKPAKKYRVIR